MKPRSMIRQVVWGILEKAEQHLDSQEERSLHDSGNHVDRVVLYIEMNDMNDHDQLH